MFYKQPMAPESVKCFNPAFDVTDHTLIAGIVTEKEHAEHLTKKAWAALFGEEKEAD